MLLLVWHLTLFSLASCGYTPGGDEVMAGSVLLPASRRGRYLANIVRRQAVDGTGIKFNKDADRINAEAKKKVDVLSEELLPYIIAEQERRTTLYKRVMTAIQNGEKGVTVAEIRNKPPLIIRKGLMYRCPMNRAPKEPDGSGIIMCEDDIEPSPVMFDSCLSAEDKDLYVADNKYFFCNRHKIEGPDLPRNGSSVIGCAPMERTSLDYTTAKCTLEDTDDVVVHYRYYPDKTYKFVTELDPDKEVCDHWNPCQIGYIYSLPAPDQALPANELWHNYDIGKFVPPIPEDSMYEFVHPAQAGRAYETVPRRLRVPPGYTYDSIWRVKDPYGGKTNPRNKIHKSVIHSEVSPDGKYITLQIKPKWSSSKYGPYYAVFTKEVNNRTLEKSLDLVHLEKASVSVLDVKSLELMAGQKTGPVQVPYRCGRCELLRVAVRCSDFHVYNLESCKFRLMEDSDRQKVIQVDLGVVRPRDVGYFMMVFRTDDNSEENVKFLVISYNELSVSRIKLSANSGEHVDKSVTYGCAECDVTDVVCNGESVLPGGRITIVKTSSKISFSFPSFEDNNTCVYIAVFKKGDKNYMNIVAVIDTVTVPEPPMRGAPDVGVQFETEIPMACDECTIDKVLVNGIQLEAAPSRRSGLGPIAYYMVAPSSLTIRISQFASMYEGVYQATFDVRGEKVTKTILELGNSTTTVEEGDSNKPTTAVSETSETAQTTAQSMPDDVASTTATGEATDAGNDAATNAMTDAVSDAESTAASVAE